MSGVNSYNYDLNKWVYKNFSSKKSVKKIIINLPLELKRYLKYAANINKTTFRDEFNNRLAASFACPEGSARLDLVEYIVRNELKRINLNDKDVNNAKI